MSHATERKEKNCLNCGTTVLGRYCHVCGQENLEPKESVWHLITHFFNDITHFDGKFFSTLKYLIAKPGFLPAEYMIGRRNSYLNPVRMYIFTSAIFFLVFFSIAKPEFNTTINKESLEDIAQMDSVRFNAFTANINKGMDRPAVPMTREEFKKYADSVTSLSPVRFSVDSGSYETKEQYDELLRTGKRKDNWFQRQINYKQVEINQKYGHNGKEIRKAFVEAFLHSLPQLLFISLPLLALLLKLLYIRRKQYYYVSHGIFSIHLYIFIFITILIQIGIGRLHSAFHFWVFNLVNVVLGFYIMAYTFMAMKRFYKQGIFKTTIKFLLLLFFFIIMMTLLLVIFVFFSFYKI